MRKAALGLALVAVLDLVFARALCADVIPSRPANPSRTEKGRVASELVKRGVSPADSAAQVKEMSSRDLAYFGEDGRRIRLAAGLTWEEWVVGGGMLIGLAGLVAYLIIHSTNKP
ncbi:MAG: hypothetical protein HYY17_17260 [Planctomycetes bacterium]|nr:hypothetical protein [Planctomycetota bacterium]